MTPHTDTLFTAAALTGSQTGSEFAMNTARGVTHVPVVASYTAGTGSLLIQGRNSPADDWQTLDTLTADEPIVVARMNRYRVTTSDAVGLSAKVTIGSPVKLVA